MTSATARAVIEAPVLQSINTAPDYDRVMVAGWQPQSGAVQGYWWYHEDVTLNGRALDTPHATHWFPIVRPEFPKGPLA